MCGSQADAGERLASAASICPGRISGPASSQTISPAAMKLNMIVVMTMWLPR